MAEFLPSAVNYQEPLAVLPPDAQNFVVACVPSNGSSFGPSSIIQVDLGSRGFLDPASLMIRYKFTSTATGSTKMVGTPAYTPFLRLDTFVNSQNIESINNWNTVANLLTNLQLSVADKYGQQYGLGYVDGGTASNGSLEPLDGRLCASGGESGFLSAPIHCSLAYSEKLIPLFLLNGIRLQFTMDTLANMCSNLSGDATNVFTAFQITNFEVVYNCVDLGASAQAEVIRMNPKIKIKSQSFSTSVAPVSVGTSGAVNLIYNQRFASIKSAYLNMGGTSTTYSANKNMDSFDITSGTGDYQLNIGGQAYPQKPLSAINNKAGILQELRRSMNTIFGSNVSMSVNSYEFTNNSGSSSSYTAPAKFWVGINLQKLSIPQKAFFTGVSSQSSPISAVINIGSTATSQLHNVMLILNYDLIYEIDTATHQLIVVQ
jgi:hypothetical protein